MTNTHNNYKLAARIMLALALGAVCHGQAFAAGYTTADINGGGHTVFEAIYLSKGYHVLVDPSKPATDSNTVFAPSQYDFSDSYKTAFNKGLSYWADMFGAQAQNSRPVQVFVTTLEKYGNAYAGDLSLHFPDHISSENNNLKEAIQNDYTISPLDPSNSAKLEGWKDFAVICIGQNMGANKAGATGGWYIDAETVLPNNEQAADYLGTIRHEMAHALGLAATTLGYYEDGKLVQDEYLNYLEYFPTEGNANETAWNMHLVDQNLNKAQPGMDIVTSDQYNKIAADDPTVKPSDYFILDNLATEAPYDTTNPRAGKVYFVGENVTEALNGATFDGVSGLPINARESKKDSKTKKVYAYFTELSHIQTPGMMSHVAYSNYTSFMEVELAVMQDLGYKLDRKNYYGFSEYGDNLTYTNTNGYSARNAAGTAYVPGEYNTTALGIGLHVYGSHNNITQAADILTKGDGAAGMRIDGEGNTVTVAKDTQVRSDGYRGIGALIAYGNNQTLNQAGTISADGKGGVGVRFDFGSSTNGAWDEYRGSYIRYQRDVSEETGAIIEGKNLPLYEKNKSTPATPELDGPLVKEYNLSGKLSAATDAIYIGKNALVENINVLAGASISGNITSDWKHFDTDGSYDGGTPVGDKKNDPLRIQYEGNSYAYDTYILDLVTKLNFAADLDYTGNITGEDNIKINVKGGTLNYSGTADVVAVNIDKGASLLGSGTYAVNDMSELMAEGFSDENTGKIINHGTFGATTGDVYISGNLISDGSLAIGTADTGTKAYLLNIDGSADITDNKLVAAGKNKPLLNTKYNYLIATDGITGNVLVSQLSDYVTATGTVEGNNGYFTATQTKSLEDTDNLNSNEASIIKAFNAVAPIKMSKGGDQGQQAANVFYNKAAEIKRLMNSVGAAERTKLLGQTPMSNLTTVSLLERMDTSAVSGTVNVPVQVSSLDGENKTVNTKVPVTLDTDNNLWMKMFRGFENYGGTDGDSDLDNHTTGGILGYDKAVGDNARLGGFFAYGQTHYSTSYLNGDSNDWRFGFYGNKQNGDWVYQAYVSCGANNYDIDAYTWDSSEKLNSDYKAKIWDLGVKAKYTIPSTAMRTWQVKPYGELGYTRTNQDGYTETGNNVFAKNIDSATNNSTRAELGVEFKRSITPTSGWGGSIGYKRILSGANPELNGTFVDGTKGFTVRTENDRNYLTYNLNAHLALGGRWTGQAELRGEKSSNNHKEVYSVMAKYHF